MATFESIAVIVASTVVGLLVGAITALLASLLGRLVGSVAIEPWLDSLLSRLRRGQRSSQTIRPPATWPEIWSVTEQLSDSEHLSEGDVQRLRRAARQLPDLDFPNPLYRQHCLGAERGG